MKQDLTIPHGALDGIEAFLRVAERRSFSAAAADLGVSPSAISQTVKALEARIGAPLFMRTTRSVGLTQAGEMFLERAAPAYSGIADAYEAARNLGNRPAGRLRINLMRGAVQPLFEPIIAGFCEAYPEIELEIYADDALSDLSAGGFDAGVRMGESLDADVIAVRLTGPFRFVVAGTPAYFEKYGRPETPEDLRNHRCVRFRLATGALMPWTFEKGNREFDVAVTGPVIVNDWIAATVAMRSGIAMIMTAEPVAKAMVETGEVELVLTEFAGATSGLFLYYPSRKQVMPKLRAFIDYVREYLPDDLSGRSA
ncbi:MULTISPECIES: LysR family transcriptional regulator [unclassified Sphingopyxis]|uniref:LysR family transcriptional regulator n=1 Tax=unclassified Sphingopyxis TaxID=2614943 RepID=UPI0007303E64|nr:MULTISPECIES: LysR family transcriptional regulator [unclassified Sphingopyxis]KTE23758.1 transcriptional regulator [Sphingopyxis sp. H057]KTE50225.1 transcriptional regulator [Sphingopyxis sp. H073]KTE50612.1 transcriptional regulator [Sphingopyxis sp. H071]KTE59900.1 transcriptional regulator [Sphingopyxis sp. H107]KTE63681.1 transcriptional regulator [Sphingopyxis sp. H100]